MWNLLLPLSVVTGLLLWSWLPGWLLARRLGINARRHWPLLPTLALSLLPFWIALAATGAQPWLVFIVTIIILLVPWRRSDRRGGEYRPCGCTFPEAPADRRARRLSLLVGIGWAALIAPVLWRFGPLHLPGELWFDVHQRFGIVRALTRAVPPENEFLVGRSLRYYYYFAWPFAQLLPWCGGDGFLVWRVWLMHAALLAPPATFSLLRLAGLGRRAALAGIMLLFVGCSWEWLLLRNPAFNEWTGTLTDYLRGYRPDHQTGVVMLFSDQTLWEGFVFAPQNWIGPALGLMLLVALVRGQAVWAALLAGGLVGANTFVALPALGGAGLALLVTRASWRWRVGMAALISASVLMCAGLTRLIPAALACGAMPIAATGVWLLRAPHFARARQVTPRACTIAPLVLLAGAGLLFFGALPLNTVKYLLSYGPAFPLAVGACGLLAWRCARRRRFIAGQPGTIRLAFIAGGLSTIWLLTLVLMTQRPHYGLPGPFAALGWLYDAVHVFNFYQKAMMLGRILVVLLAAPLAAMIWRAVGRLESPLLIRAARSAIALVLITASGTLLLQPWLYLQPYQHPEAGLVSAYAQAARPGDVLLTQSYRGNQFHMAGPARLWFFSQWDEAAWWSRPGHGSWATQYALASDQDEIERREGELRIFFADSTSAASRAAMLHREGITLVHSLAPLDVPGLHAIAHAEPGGWLYRFDPVVAP